MGPRCYGNGKIMSCFQNNTHPEAVSGGRSAGECRRPPLRRSGKVWLCSAQVRVCSRHARASALTPPPPGTRLASRGGFASPVEETSGRQGACSASTSRTPARPQACENDTSRHERRHLRCSRNRTKAKSGGPGGGRRRPGARRGHVPPETGRGAFGGEAWVGDPPTHH